ncbi:copper resistance protein CopC [Conexibacter sp. CPCC 206217]|uniref:copper resistance CopC/CopD family protein n=1 Tax=Conexibacter sp. CPCC 206217 TaxID=3064574 RepID=UPI0027244FDD|nr:copper resistance protein CopC [Conexibacter sp. CPCC 206217]MDO8208821.1 copper resistance protein CopC [Conexibacter sp. CPCC 206217]
MARRRSALALAMAVTVLAGAAPTAASAHTSLVAATPAPGSVAASAPRALTLTFSEPVDAGLAAVHVVAPDGRRVDVGAVAPRSGASKRLRVALRGGLRDGTYAVAYRIVSVDDGHTIPGGYRLSVGHVGAPPPVRLDELIARVGPPPGTSTELDVARGVRDGGLVVLLGALIALLMVWRPALADLAGPSDDWRRAAGRGGRALRRLVVGAALAGAAGSLTLVALQGAVASGGGLADAFAGRGLGAVAGTRFGAVGLGAAALLAALGAGVWASGRPRRVTPAPQTPARAERGDLRLAELGATGVAVPARADAGLVLAAAIAVVLLPLVPALTGHAAARDADQAVPFAAAHVLGAGVWAGGVAALAAALFAVRTLGPTARRELTATLVRRFGPWALGAVALIAVSGLLQALERLSAPADLTQTAYGRALLVKAGLLLIVVGVAAGHQAEEGARARRAERSTRRRLAAELAGVAAILAATAALSGYPPPDTAAGAAATGTLALDFHAARLEGALTPARAGRTTLAFALADRRGRAFDDLERIDLTLRPPGGAGAAAAADASEIRRTLRMRRDGSYRLALVIPRGGRWRLGVRLRIDRFISYQRSQVLEISSP